MGNLDNSQMKRIIIPLHCESQLVLGKYTGQIVVGNKGLIENEEIRVVYLHYCCMHYNVYTAVCVRWAQ